MMNMFDRLKLNWEAMPASSRRKTLVFGSIAGVITLIISIGILQQIFSVKQPSEVQAGNSVIATELGRGPAPLGIERIIQDNAAYERRQLREQLSETETALSAISAETRKTFEQIDQQLNSISSQMTSLANNVDEVGLSVARERTQRRAENELIAQELGRIGSVSGSVARPTDLRLPHDPYSAAANDQPEFVELSPFDMLAFTDLTGMQVAQVGYSSQSVTDVASTVPASTSPTRSQGQVVPQDTGQQTTEDLNRPGLDEFGLDAYDRGELTTVPAGSVMTGVLVSGLDAPVGQTAQSNPHPVIAKLTGRVLLPNGRTMDLRGCAVLASGYGDLSTEKVYLQTTILSCIGSDDRIYETNVQSSALGSDGKVGLRGRMVTRDGALIARSMQAGLVQGLALALQGGRPSFSVQTDEPYALPDANYLSRTMIGEGVVNSLDVMIQRYNRLMDQIFPVIEVDAGRKIEFQVLSKFDVRVE